MPLKHPAFSFQLFFGSKKIVEATSWLHVAGTVEISRELNIFTCMVIRQHSDWWTFFLPSWRTVTSDPVRDEASRVAVPNPKTGISRHGTHGMVTSPCTVAISFLPIYEQQERARSLFTHLSLVTFTWMSENRMYPHGVYASLFRRVKTLN